LRNITERGAGIRLHTQLKLGEKVLITIKDIEPFFAAVVWWEQNRAGLKFEELFDPSLLIIKSSGMVEVEGIYKSDNGYHVFDRFKPVSDFKRPGVKAPKKG
jgi:hypothetical protein